MNYKVKQTKTNLQKYFHSSCVSQLILVRYMRTCNSGSQKRSAKGSILKEDDRDKLLLYDCTGNFFLSLDRHFFSPKIFFSAHRSEYFALVLHSTWVAGCLFPSTGQTLSSKYPQWLALMSTSMSMVWPIVYLLTKEGTHALSASFIRYR